MKERSAECRLNYCEGLQRGILHLQQSGKSPVKDDPVFGVE